MSLNDVLIARRADALEAASRLSEEATKRGALRDAANEQAMEDALDTVVDTDAALRALSNVKVRKEPRVYERDSRHSYFFDRAAAISSTPIPGLSDHAANERLARHEQEEAVEQSTAFRQGKAARTLGASGVIVNDSSSYAGPDGSIQARTGDLTSAIAGGPVPTWILDEYYGALYAASPLLARVKNLPLPPTAFSVTVPGFTGADVTFDPVVTENTGVDDIMGTTSEDVTHDVSSFAGQTIISQQLQDRGPSFDLFITQSFAEATAASIEAQLVNGDGSDNQFLGLLNVPGLVPLTPGGPGLDVVGFAQQVGNLVGAVADTRNRMPSIIAMRPSRYAWLAGIPNSNGVSNQLLGLGGVTDSDNDLYGPLGGVGVVLTNAIPNDLGDDNNQDAVLVLRVQDILLLVSDPIFTVYEQTYANQLSVILGTHGYATAVTDRYPLGIGALTGAGLEVPTY